MKKIYLLLFAFTAFSVNTFAQPTVLQSSLFTTAGNTTPNSSNFRLALTAPSGYFNQVRFLANTGGSFTWAFHQGTTGSPDYSTNWRPYTPADASGAISFGTYIQPAAIVNSARCNTGGGGGTDGNLPTITSGRYYTFNITNNPGACLACVAATSSGGTCNSMQILETSYNPVTINTVSATTPANASNSVLVTATTSAAPSSGEYVYVRYSTSMIFTTSTISQFTFNGSTGTALIPCFAGGTTVYYYVYSSNKTLAAINADVTSYGEYAHDMATLNLNNSGGANYSYVQGNGAFFGGIYSVPSPLCYTTISSFVTALNAGTVTAPVTCYAIGGSPTETATAGGISITQTGTVANPIVFQKFGSGSYTIQASAALTVGAINDAIIKLIGSDYITIDGLTLQENGSNTTTGGATPANGATGNNMTEWGIALLHASITDGAQNNTIQNNTISLNISYAQTWGIYSNVRHSATVVGTTQDITNNTTAPNNTNKVYGNTISNVNMGIAFIGSGTAANQDVSNDIGGASAATGNIISNWGGAAVISTYISNSNTSYCIFMNHQTSDNTSYNTITSASVSGTSVTFRGIVKDYTSTAPTGTFTSTINNNTITMSSGFTSGTFRAINTAWTGAALSTFTLNINNNSIVNCVMSGAASSSTFNGILNSAIPGTLSISSNIIRGYTSTATTGGFTGIQNSGAIVNTININGNKIGDAISGAATFSVATSGQINPITNSGAAATCTININSNSIDGISVVSSGQLMGIQNTGASDVAVNINNNLLGSTTGTLMSFSAAQTSGAQYLINNQGGTTNCVITIQGNDMRGLVHTVAASTNQGYIINAAVANSVSISSNTFTNMNVNTTGQIILINRLYSMTSGAVFNCTNNSIVTGFSKTGAGSSLYCYDAFGLSVNGSTENITGNNFSNITLSGVTGFYGIYDVDGAVAGTSGPTKNITGNSFNTIAMGSGTFTGMNLDKGATITCSANSITNVTGAGGMIGIYTASNVGPGNCTYSGNTISNLSSTGAFVNVIALQGGSTSVPVSNFSNNTLTGLSSTGSNASVIGIWLSAGATANINDNAINNLSGSGSIAPLALGIWVSNSTTVNIYNNKIHTISETGTLSLGDRVVKGIYISGSTTLTAYNNFIANLNAPATNEPNAVIGISVESVTANTTYNLYYNSVYINATSTGTDFGTSGIYHTTNTTATTAALNMIDNIVVNTSTPNGTGVTAAYRRSDATLTNYASTSDYNLLYAGTPSATKLIYYDGTNSSQSLAAYQTLVSTRDANSLSALPAFTSTTNLHLTTANCQLDGRGTPISITTDIDGTTRNVTTPDIGADEFTATTSTNLAGVVGSAVCETRAVSGSGTTFTSNACDLIANILPSGANPVSGRVNVCVTLVDTVGLPLPVFNAEPYLPRHFDIEPTTANTTTTSATITLYFTQAEFNNYNNKNGTWPDLPTGPADAAGKANLKVTQYHGTATTSPSTPGNYTAAAGTGIYIDPVDANIVWNGSYWAVTFNVTGFSGFYVHTNPRFALPISLNYINGIKQVGKHLITWKVTCNTTPSATLTLERSADARNFTQVYTTNATALRCAQPFDYTDAQPLAGINYYRLKMVDADGKITYSNTIALINASKGFELLSIAPNPVTKGIFKLNATAARQTKTEVVISDIQGRVVNRQRIILVAGYNSIDMNVDQLAPGTYNISSITAEEKTRVIRFVKQ